ncbi:ATP-binding protein [Cytophagales bacterium LB-30]|uniref:ATP-binding protein n=1 Tax=Shiella aurantiaca TaxID=3058365 RepID=A0ABT8F202_9BACT|nr:ATP-binding protein [Shiella aurantiaca]MDN4164476.1 ATP-binding protein [Shiella aurantiaca]
MDKLIKVAITGPESTGKSYLAKALAKHYATQWVPEFARQYLETLGRPYAYSDILTMAQGQKKEEIRLGAKANSLLFCDTELINHKIWSLHKYGRVDEWIEASIRTQPYDVYLLCDIDMPWEPDPLRENPDERFFFFHWFQKEIKVLEKPFYTISGMGAQRVQRAIDAIDDFLARRKA